MSSSDNPSSSPIPTGQNVDVFVHHMRGVRVMKKEPFEAEQKSKKREQGKKGGL